MTVTSLRRSLCSVPKVAVVDTFNCKILRSANAKYQFYLFSISRLFAVPYFLARSFRYTASYCHGYLDFQIYQGDGRRGL